MAQPAWVVVDTSVWIEHLTGSELGQRLVPFFPAPDRCLVPTLVQLELYKWLLREATEEQADEVIAFTQVCTVVALDTPLALLSAQLHRQHRLATADAIVYATALSRNARLLTCDAHFADLPHVQYVPKLGAH